MTDHSVRNGSTTSQKDALRIAHDLVDLGVPVFVATQDPSDSDGFRRPKSWHRTKPDHAIVNSWQPGDALCAVMGIACDVIDVDLYKAEAAASEAGWRNAGLWPRTYGTASTPSGGTHHLIARLRAGSRDKIAPGIDIKGGRNGEVADAGRGYIWIAPTERISKSTGELAAYTWTSEPDFTGMDEVDDESEELAKLVYDAIGQGKADDDSAEQAPSAEYEALPPDLRKRVDGHCQSILKRIQGELLEAQHMDHGALDGKGRGWEKLTADAAYDLGSFVRATWNGLSHHEAKAFFLRCAPVDATWSRRNVEKKWYSQYGRKPVARQPEWLAEATTEPPPPAPLPSMNIAGVHAVFRKWLGGSYELDALDAVLCAAAVERLDGDPLWLLIVSGSGNAKTEMVSALVGAGATVTSTITSEGALLSATSRKEQTKDATGGLLRKIGDRGVLVIKDFTSVLSMNRDQRAAVLAALREVYDGKWERNVGTDGGKTLTWNGRLVLVGAVTSAYDAAHAVIAAMGDRFALIRVDSNLGRKAAGMQALSNVGQEIEMRAELAEAVGAALNTVRPELAVLAESDQEELMRAADLVTLARTAVERDFKGDLIDAHAPEMPTRFAKMLGQAVRGALSLGMSHDRALAIAHRIAADSMTPMRLLILCDVMAFPYSRLHEIVKRLDKPRTTVDRALQELHLLGLVRIEEALPGTQGWRYLLASEVDLDVLSRLKQIQTVTRNVTTPTAPVKEENPTVYLSADISGYASPNGHSQWSADDDEPQF